MSKEFVTFKENEVHLTIMQSFLFFIFCTQECRIFGGGNNVGAEKVLGI